MVKSLVLLSVFFTSFCFFDNSFAKNIPLNGTISGSKKSSHRFLHISRDKRKRESEENKENTPNIKRRKINFEKASEDNGFQVFTPRTKERKILSPYRRRMVLKEYRDNTHKKKFVASPDVRDIYQNLDRCYDQSICVNGKTVYQGDFLFDPSAMVLTEGKWVTNLQRMEQGKCPIGYRGIVTMKERSTLTRTEIEKRQKAYRIELHHLIQRDSGTENDPICEMTHVAHMGTNARFILEFDEEKEEICIIHSSLEKDEAQKLCDPNQFIVTNVFHFRPDTLINRNAFAEWRVEYWKTRAKDWKLSSTIVHKKMPVSPYKAPAKKILLSDGEF